MLIVPRMKNPILDNNCHIMHPNLSSFPYGLILNPSVECALHILFCVYSAMKDDQEGVA